MKETKTTTVLHFYTMCKCTFNFFLLKQQQTQQKQKRKKHSLHNVCACLAKLRSILLLCVEKYMYIQHTELKGLWHANRQS